MPKPGMGIVLLSFWFEDLWMAEMMQHCDFRCWNKLRRDLIIQDLWLTKKKEKGKKPKISQCLGFRKRLRFAEMF